MLEPTTQLLTLRDADDPEKTRLVHAPPKIRGRYVDVTDYYTGEEIRAHVADLETVEQDPQPVVPEEAP